MINHGFAIGDQECRDRPIPPVGERSSKLSLFIVSHFERALKGGGRRIIDRADQTGDVARGRCLAPALDEWTPRFAVEIEDKNVVLDDKHLAEMQVAVMANIQSINLSRQQCLQAIGEPGLLDQQSVNKRPVGFLQGIAPMSQRIEDALEANEKFADPALGILTLDGLRREFGQRPVARQRDMHFGDAVSCLRHITQIGDLILAFALPKRR